MGDLLYGLVRLVKPKLVVETGTFVADSATRIGEALRDNGFGHLHTCDIEPQQEAYHRLSNLPVTLHVEKGVTLIQKFPSIDFIFIDSGLPHVRYEEILLLSKWNIPPLGIVCWHDACVEMHKPMYEAFTQINPWPHLMFPSMVGFVVFQRPEHDIDPASDQEPSCATSQIG